MPDTKQEGVVSPEGNEGEGGGTEVETIAIPKTEYEKINQTIGSLKRELKDLRKPKEESVTSEQTKPDENHLLQKLERMSLRQAGITHEDDVELARKTAKKWGVDIDEVLGDEDFKVKLERQQSQRSNVEATSGVRGGAGTSQAKNTPEYWLAKGVPPSPTDIPDAKVRRKIAREFIKSSKGGGKTFYNDQVGQVCSFGITT